MRRPWSVNVAVMCAGTQASEWLSAGRYQPSTSSDHRRIQCRLHTDSQDAERRTAAEYACESVMIFITAM